jgi:hypothetical protein
MAFIPANQKIMRVGSENNMGNLSGMQPTTQAIYDTFDLSGASATGNFTIPFFQGVNAKVFPFTNLSQNRLTAGRSFAVQQFYLSVFTIANGKIDTVETLDSSGFTALVKSELTLIVSNTQVIERYPISGSVGPFNRDATFSNSSVTQTAAAAPGTPITQWHSHSVKVLPAQPVILPDQEFICNVQIPAITLPSAGTHYLQLTLEGFGTLFAPNGTL